MHEAHEAARRAEAAPTVTLPVSVPMSTGASMRLRSAITPSLGAAAHPPTVSERGDGGDCASPLARGEASRSNAAMGTD